MNIYLITEEDSSFCIRAKTMADAIKVCESSYIDDVMEDNKNTTQEEYERGYYHTEILQSCTLVGELRN